MDAKVASPTSITVVIKLILTLDTFLRGPSDIHGLVLEPELFSLFRCTTARTSS